MPLHLENPLAGSLRALISNPAYVQLIFSNKMCNILKVVHESPHLIVLFIFGKIWYISGIK